MTLYRTQLASDVSVGCIRGVCGRKGYTWALRDKTSCPSGKIEIYSESMMGIKSPEMAMQVIERSTPQSAKRLFIKFEAHSGKDRKLYSHMFEVFKQFHPVAELLETGCSEVMTDGVRLEDLQFRQSLLTAA